MTRALSHDPRTLSISLLFVLLALPGGAAERVALVIGNGAYQRAPLANPVNDARDMKAALEAVGFQVAYLENGTERQMKAAVRDFGKRIRGAEVRLFY